MPDASGARKWHDAIDEDAALLEQGEFGLQPGPVDGGDPRRLARGR
jgi:hypothetical protein